MVEATEFQAVDSQEALCPQCKAIFSGVRDLRDDSQATSTWPPPTHHASAESFEAAIEAGCILCHRLLVGLRIEGRGNIAAERKAASSSMPFSAWGLRTGQKPRRYALAIDVFYPEEMDKDEPDWRRQEWYTLRHQLYSLEKTANQWPTERVLADHGRSTNSPGAWKQARNWYEECRNSHELCNARRAATPGYVPSRLLDLSGDGDHIKLIVTSDGSDTTWRDYATLSHCWGSAEFLRLVAENEAELRQSIALSRLPQTFIEAIEVANKFGIRYLWIDSLCIIQDSILDWQKESSLMEEVYSNSLLNIMATASSDGHQGLFRDRDPRELEHCAFRTAWEDLEPEVLVVGNHKLWDELIMDSPLGQRGWVLQERVLAPRALHFAHNQLAWECHEKDACEMFPETIPKVLENLHSRVKILDADDYLRWTTSWMEHDFSPIGHNGYALWSRIVKLYSGTRVTKPSDKLVAISGLAKRMRAVLNDTYLAGLWAGQLPYQLTWMTPNGGNAYNKPQKYRAPSWSWASADREAMLVTPRESGDPVVHVKIDEAQVTPLSDLDDTAEVTDGYIRLKARLIPAKLRCVGNDTHYVRYPDLIIDGMMVSGMVSMDETPATAHKSIVYLPVWEEKMTRFGGTIYALLLEPVEGQPQGWYSRIGTAATWQKPERDDGAWRHIRMAMTDEAYAEDAPCLEGAPRTIMLV